MSGKDAPRMTAIEKIIKTETERQENAVELIASENFPSQAVLEACGSILTNKYAEGYPEPESVELFIREHPDYVHTGKTGRYYGGCENIDQIELEARYRMQKAFHTDYHVNVQPHSGSQANMAAYFALLKPGDTVLSMGLADGGHLTHGARVNFSGKLYDFIHYGVDENGFLDYDLIERLAGDAQPKLIVCGASAYPRIIDFKRIRAIADSVGAMMMVDMAHIAGLVAAGAHPTPFGIADVVTTTTHKTLRGPRGGVIFCKKELANKVDAALFPGCQGGPLMHIIAGKAVAATEACDPSYVDYINRVLVNTKAMAEEFIRLGYNVLTGGTDNHLFIIDLRKNHPDLTGALVQKELDKVGITLNKESVPGDERSAMETSGLRIGCAAETTKGADAEKCVEIARRIDAVIRRIDAPSC